MTRIKIKNNCHYCSEEFTSHGFFKMGKDLNLRFCADIACDKCRGKGIPSEHLKIITSEVDEE